MNATLIEARLSLNVSHSKRYKYADTRGRHVTLPGIFTLQKQLINTVHLLSTSASFTFPPRYSRFVSRIKLLFFYLPFVLHAVIQVEEERRGRKREEVTKENCSSVFFATVSPAELLSQGFFPPKSFTPARRQPAPTLIRHSLRPPQVEPRCPGVKLHTGRRGERAGSGVISLQNKRAAVTVSSLELMYHQYFTLGRSVFRP